MEQLEQTFHLSCERQTSMIVSPDILCLVQRQALPSDTAFGCQSLVQVTPEALQPVDMAVFLAAEGLVGLPWKDQSVHIAPGGNTRVAGDCVGADCRPRRDLQLLYKVDYGEALWISQATWIQIN